jgi:hypothetical protein
MSATLERETRVAKVLTSLKPLLKEYIARIEKIGDQVLHLLRYSFEIRLGSAEKAWLRAEFVTLDETFTRIRPDAEDVDRRASGLIENAGIDEMDRWELLLRLAELESALATTQARLSAALPRVK